jgi:RNA polymerase sigma factor for flagellar operon FliA
MSCARIGYEVIDLTDDHYNMVKAIAANIKRSNRKFEYEDLVQYGMIGLLESAKRYNRLLGVKFTTFAFPRIRGAILDHIKSHEEMILSPDGNVDMVNDDDTMEEKLSNDQLRDRFRTHLLRLPRRERELLLSDFGDRQKVYHRHGIKRSWASRIKLETIKLLKNRMAE